MTRQFPLQSLLDLSQLRLDEATRQLGELISGEQEASQRLTLLSQYRAEYQERFVTAAKNGLTPKEWQNFRNFLQKLDDAVNQAGVMASQSKQRTAAGQQEWLAKRGKVKAFDTLSQRHQSRLASADHRREQKDSDEHTAHRFGHAEEDE
jgi:flagellar FliJ protein